jgi:hypothetical protein
MISRTYNLIIIDNVAFIPKKTYKYISMVLFTHNLRIDSKTILSSTPNGDNHFKILATTKNNFFKTFLHWSLINLNRDDYWRKDMIDTIGIELFAQEYENLFTSTKEYNRYINLNKLV